MADGLEARVPFLDRQVISFAFGLPMAWKQAAPGEPEKRMLRRAFHGWLPEEILWRVKAEFGDGSGAKDVLKRTIEDDVSHGDFERDRGATDPPLRTREEFAYHRIFAEHLPGVRPGGDARALRDGVAAVLPGGRHRLRVWSAVGEGRQQETERVHKTIAFSPDRHRRSTDLLFEDLDRQGIEGLSLERDKKISVAGLGDVSRAHPRDQRPAGPLRDRAARSVDAQRADGRGPQGHQGVRDVVDRPPRGRTGRCGETSRSPRRSSSRSSAEGGVVNMKDEKTHSRVPRRRSGPIRLLR